MARNEENSRESNDEKITDGTAAAGADNPTPGDKDQPLSDEDLADEQGDESFPASDAPANY
ncbi:hypothetical protein CAPI_07930 [Corynebacterium capitovis DSM 44611]|uniref:hypothetical protein n=1 Tax=Corynebacterium capitovis TaxID=131081 RepID=UPI000362F7C6|nr:hypothetical protein [Corynebacterium capitovis]WKD58114.1 hypothetical protein CAPI_07930 [Corynebacterium capitovis DSM 44611]